MAGIPRGKSRPPVSPQALKIGDALRERRLSPMVGKRQEDVALDANISQKLVSQVERGEQDLRASGLNTILGLLRALKWTLADLQVATGVDLGVPNAELLAGDEPTPVYSLEALAAASPEPDGVSLSPNNGQHPANWKLSFMDGDEMSPNIRDGESLYFNTDLTTPEKGIYVIVHTGRTYVRRYSQLPSGPAWTAINPAYAHDFIPASDTVKVLGRVYRIVGIREDLALLN